MAAAALCPVVYSPPQKVEEKGNWFHGPSETEKGALAERSHVMIMYVPLLWLGVKNL